MSGIIGSRPVVPRPVWAAGASALLAFVLIAIVAVAPAPAGAAKGKRGIDVSRFQRTIDWAAVGSTKVRFAYVAASRGSGSDCLVAAGRCGEDRYFDRNYEGARANGIKVGAYHRAFASGKTRALAKKDAQKEARVFARSVGKVRGKDLVPALDLEAPFKNLSQDRLRYWTAVWLERVEKKLGAKPIIYTNASSWAATGDTQRFAKRGHRLWVANFDVPSPAVPAANWAGEGYAIWQHTSSGHVRGINGNVDKNKLGIGLGQLLAGS